MRRPHRHHGRDEQYGRAGGRRQTGCGVDAHAEGACPTFLGLAWNGVACVSLIGCTCVGADCASLYPDVPSCTSACQK